MAGPGPGTGTRGTNQRGTGDAGLGTGQGGADAGNRGTQDRGLKDAGTGQASAPDQATARAPEEAVTVWAFREFTFRPNREGGWTHTFRISGLDDLFGKLAELKLQHRVSKLAIVTHGDQGGVVLIDGVKEEGITLKNLDSFSKQFAQLATFLTPDGWLLFESCVAGAGLEGSVFLKKISLLLQAKQQVIGFIVWGKNMIGSLMDAGELYAVPGGGPIPKGAEKMNEHSQYAKWAQNGRIIVLPVHEVVGNLKGKWKVSSATMGDMTVKEFDGAILNVRESSQLNFAKNGKEISAGTYDARPGKPGDPNTIDVAFTNGSLRGKTLLGIFRYGDRDADAFTICFSEPLKTPSKQASKAPPKGLPGEKRPTEFASPPKSKQLLIELKRSPDQ